MRNKSFFQFCTLLFLVLSFSKIGFSQTKQRLNLPNYDAKRIHYGFQIGLNQHNFRVVQSQEFVDADSIKLYPTSGQGFNLGFILNLRIHEFADLRFLPNVAFYNNQLNFDYPNSPNVGAIFESNIIQLPFTIKYKSQRRSNNRLYMFAGINPQIRVGNKKGDKNKKQDEQIAITRLNFSLDYGIGLDHYFPLFKFAPELRFTYGLANVLAKQESNKYNKMIDRMNTYAVSLFFLFE